MGQRIILTLKLTFTKNFYWALYCQIQLLFTYAVWILINRRRCPSSETHNLIPGNHEIFWEWLKLGIPFKIDANGLKEYTLQSCEEAACNISVFDDTQNETTTSDLNTPSDCARDEDSVLCYAAYSLSLFIDSFAAERIFICYNLAIKYARNFLQKVIFPEWLQYQVFIVDPSSPPFVYWVLLASFLFVTMVTIMLAENY